MLDMRFPKKEEVRTAVSKFSRREWWIVLALTLVLCVSTIAILQNINKSFEVSVPAEGGSISEGIVGTPRFVNPLLAFSDADLDLVPLIYSGLMRKLPDGTLVPDLAEKYEVSEDGLEYTFTLRENIYFHDDEPVTADDVIFTISTAKDAVNKSPRKRDWDGILVEKIDDRTIRFSLREAYASFLENATMGILPAHVWEGSPIELNDANINPIGTGPYKVDGVRKQSSGTIDYYELSQFKKFALGRPFIKKITLHFYPNEEALVSGLLGGEVDQASSISPENAEIVSEKYRVESSVLPRIFGLFFNQSQNQLFTSKNVVNAIDLAIDKDRIVREVLGGFGVAIDNPIPPNMAEYETLAAEATVSHEENVAKAVALLEKDGWNKNEEGILEKTTTVNKKKTTTPLTFSISTGNAPELVRSAELVKEDLASIGITVDIKTFEVGNLNQSVIRPRKYDALLFGQIINRESDLFAFWHSSQRKDPGLNVAMYTNAKVDKILEDAFVTTNEEARAKKYAQFEDEVKKDVPAVFLYSPKFIYIVSKDLQNLSIDHITSPADRFSNAYLWYTDTDNVWKIFAKN